MPLQTRHDDTAKCAAVAIDEKQDCPGIRTDDPSSVSIGGLQSPRRWVVRSMELLFQEDMHPRSCVVMCSCYIVIRVVFD